MAKLTEKLIKKKGKAYIAANKDKMLATHCFHCKV